MTSLLATSPGVAHGVAFWVTGMLLVAGLTVASAVFLLFVRRLPHDRVLSWAARWGFTRFWIFPVLALVFDGNPEAYERGQLLGDVDKPAFYDAAVSYCHPITAVLPAVNAGEVWIWFGVLAGLVTVSAPWAPVMGRYLLLSLVLIAVRGWVTRAMTLRLLRRAGRLAGRNPDDPAAAGVFATAWVRPGADGWGRGLYITPSAQRFKIVSVTGGGVHPVAQRLAAITGAVAVDGFQDPCPAEEMACAVIDCGGTARIGIYPKMGIPTVDVIASSPSGPLARFITPDNFVSGVTPQDVQERGGPSAARTADTGEALGGVLAPAGQKGFAPVPQAVEAARAAVHRLLRDVLPLSILGVLLGGVLLTTWSPLRLITHDVLGTAPGLLLVSGAAALPPLARRISAASLVAQLLTITVGLGLATHAISPRFSLAALFAVNGQVGADFIPTALTLEKSDRPTANVAARAILYTRPLTSIAITAAALLWAVG